MKSNVTPRAEQLLGQTLQAPFKEDFLNLFRTELVSICQTQSESSRRRQTGSKIPHGPARGFCALLSTGSEDGWGWMCSAGRDEPGMIPWDETLPPVGEGTGLDEGFTN